MQLQLSDGERLILAMLSELYQKLGVKGDIDPEFVKTVVWGNDDWALAWKYDWLFPSRENPKEVEETANILSMWRVLEQSYANLSKADKDRIKVEAHPFGDEVKFVGFDANNDPHQHIAEVIVNVLGRFEERKGKIPNSHSSATITGYRSMLQEYQAVISEKAPTGQLTTDDLIRILSARKQA